MRVISLILFLATLLSAQDAYEEYVQTSKDFECVEPVDGWSGWIYMPWTYRWPIG